MWHYFDGLEIKLLVLIKDYKSVILAPNMIPLDSTDMDFAYRYNYGLELLYFTSAKLRQVQIVVIFCNTPRFKIGVFVHTSEGSFITWATILYRQDKIEEFVACRIYNPNVLFGRQIYYSLDSIFEW